MTIADDTGGGLGLGAMAGTVAEKLPTGIARPGPVTGIPGIPSRACCESGRLPSATSGALAGLRRLVRLRLGNHDLAIIIINAEGIRLIFTEAFSS